MKALKFLLFISFVCNPCNSQSLPAMEADDIQSAYWFAKPPRSGRTGRVLFEEINPRLMEDFMESARSMREGDIRGAAKYIFRFTDDQTARFYNFLCSDESPSHRRSFKEKAE